jgi:Family of unknown function (DUF5329)
MRYSRTLKTCLNAAVVLLGLLSVVWARDALEQARIDFLIRSVETSKGIVFIRNGSEHDGVAAAKHLQMKLNYAGERVRTAEEFVKVCASESSLTHQKYKVRLADGTTMDAVDYFAARLREFDAGKK